MKPRAIFLGLIVTLITPALAQAAPGLLKPRHILKMVKLGVREPVILQAVRAAHTWPRLKVTDVVALHKAGATPRLIDALLRRSPAQRRLEQRSHAHPGVVKTAVSPKAPLSPWVLAERRLERARRLRAARLRAKALRERIAAERARARARAARRRRDAELRAEERG